jgi:LAO/AO transport system kinase
VIKSFEKQTKESGVFEMRRQEQNRAWLHTLVEEQLRRFFFNHPQVKNYLPDIEKAVMEGTLPAASAARELLQMMHMQVE